MYTIRDSFRSPSLLSQQQGYHGPSVYYILYYILYCITLFIILLQKLRWDPPDPIITFIYTLRLVHIGKNGPSVTATRWMTSHMDKARRDLQYRRNINNPVRYVFLIRKEMSKMSSLALCILHCTPNHGDEIPQSKPSPLTSSTIRSTAHFQQLSSTQKNHVVPIKTRITI